MGILKLSLLPDTFSLYLLSIGVSKYQNSDYNLKVADKDAHAVSEMFKKQEGQRTVNLKTI